MFPQHIKKFKIELSEKESIGNKLENSWLMHHWLTDDFIDSVVPPLVKKDREDFVFISSVNIESALTKVSLKGTDLNDPATLEKITRAFAVPKSFEKKSLIIVVHGEYHWSSLICENDNNTKLSKCYHLDSKKGSNQKICCDIITLLRDCNLIFQDFKLFEPLCVQQESIWECGFYTILGIFIYVRSANQKAVNKRWKNEDLKINYMKKMFHYFTGFEWDQP